MFAFAFAYGYAIAHGEAADGLDTSFHGIGLHIENVAVVAGGGEFNQRNEQAAPIKVMAAEPYDIVGSVAVWQCGSVAVWQCGSVAVWQWCLWRGLYGLWSLWAHAAACLFIGVKPSHNQIIERFFWIHVQTG
ncbi:hypothetical protein [Eikenella sp. NML070372]|uniref:hypothetical protein n=1 Tax=Eikenella sp. NML070372 TaxID=1795829 RepID=UPI0012E856C1|nr:hypothetical protein [Eikenella sp. NML070372]